VDSRHQESPVVPATSTFCIVKGAAAGIGAAPLLFTAEVSNRQPDGGENNGVKLLSHIIAAVATLAIGVACLFLAERVDEAVSSYHQRRKRTQRATPFFLWITSLNYRRILQACGLLSLLAFLVLAFFLAKYYEEYHY